MNHSETIDWLLEGDVSIQYQVHKDLLGKDRNDLRERIAEEGWGKAFLAKRKKEGHWGDRFYQPKWISSHYTLLDMRNLCMASDHPLIQESLEFILHNEKATDGGIGPFGAFGLSDVCVNGMFLNYAAHFRADAVKLESVVDCILEQWMPDGGFNCRSNRGKPVHSSMHTSISVLEGIETYRQNGYTYRLEELRKAQQSTQEFLLLHQLYLSDRTGKVISEHFLKMPYPSRWKYDILRALDYFQFAQTNWEERLNPALQVLMKKRNKSNTWNLQAKHPGQLHFEMEKAGKPSRYNTLRMLRILKHFGKGA